MGQGRAGTPVRDVQRGRTLSDPGLGNGNRQSEKPGRHDRRGGAARHRPGRSCYRAGRVRAGHVPSGDHAQVAPGGQTPGKPGPVYHGPGRHDLARHAQAPGRRRLFRGRDRACPGDRRAGGGPAAWARSGQAASDRPGKRAGIRTVGEGDPGHGSGIPARQGLYPRPRFAPQSRLHDRGRPQCGRFHGPADPGRHGHGR